MKKNIFAVSVFIFTLIAQAQEHYIVDVNKSPKAKMKAVALDQVEWTEGFWADRHNQNKEVTLRKLWDLAVDPKAGHVLDNFRAAALANGNHEGTDWQDAWMYKWIESAATIYKETNESWIAEAMDECIGLIRGAMEDDGYIATQITSKGKPRFTEPREHEVYSMGHLLTAACVHKRMTGKTSLFDLAIRNADFLCETLGEKVSPSFAHNPSAIMGLVEMYRETGEQKYLDCAKLIVDSRGSNPKEGNAFNRRPGIIGSDLIQDRVPLRQSKEVVGHNVFFTYLYAGATDIYLETGDETLLQPLKRLWNDLTATKMCINGGVSPVGHGLSKGKDPVVEAVGSPYNLPAADSYNETCGQVGNFMWNYRMLAVTGDAKYADIMELELYNGFLGGIGLDGESWFYRNALRFNADEKELLKGHNFMTERGLPGRKRICCPTNLLRTLAQLETYFYSHDNEGIWIHHYGGTKYSGTFAGDSKINLTQHTNYPWSGNINITIDDLRADKEFAIRVRIPGWADGSIVKVNGKPVNENIVSGTYLSIVRKWKKSDKIELELPMSTKLMEANPKAEQLYNQVAVMRGPLLYCLESIDMPSDKHISKIRVPSNMTFKSIKTDLPFGIMALEGNAFYYDTKQWKNELYRPLLTSKELTNLPIKLIPYFSWNNRGPASMSVWLPLEVH